MASVDAKRPLWGCVELRRSESVELVWLGGSSCEEVEEGKTQQVGAANDYVRISRLFSGLPTIFFPLRASPLALSPLVLLLFRIRRLLRP